MLSKKLGVCEIRYSSKGGPRNGLHRQTRTGKVEDISNRLLLEGTVSEDHRLYLALCLVKFLP